MLRYCDSGAQVYKFTMYYVYWNHNFKRQSQSCKFREKHTRISQAQYNFWVQLGYFEYSNNNFKFLKNSLVWSEAEKNNKLSISLAGSGPTKTYNMLVQ